MRIVRLVHRTRAFCAAAVLSSVVAFPGTPASAVTLYNGVCTLTNVPFTLGTTPSLTGTQVVPFNFSTTQCTYALSSGNSLVGEGSVTGQYPRCGVGVFSDDAYRFVPMGMTYRGQIALVAEGASLTVSYVSTSPVGLVITGELTSPLQSNGCPTGYWSGQLVVSDPSLEDPPESG